MGDKTESSLDTLKCVWYKIRVDRLPKRFEKDVLSKHGIEWRDNRAFDADYYKAPEYLDDRAQRVSPYEIAGKGLEAMRLDLMHVRDLINHCEAFRIDYDPGHIIVDADFCTCIFKAIREIWKDE